VVSEIGEKKRDVMIPRNAPEGCEINRRQGVWIARVPARVVRVVIADVGRVPAKDDVTEFKARIDDRKDVVAMADLAAEDAADVGDSQLHLPQRVFADFFENTTVIFLHRE